jgi:hypothetical protein
MKTEISTDAKTRTTSPPTWWTPQGFVIQDAPAAYLATQEQPDGDWRKILASAGYARLTSIANEEFDLLKIYVYSHSATGHLFVEIWNEYECLSHFFVTQQFENVFFATWYLEFVRTIAQIEQAKQIKAIAKSLTAFVRYGHGVDTIDEYGEQSYDDDVRARELKAAWRARKAARQDGK